MSTGRFFLVAFLAFAAAFGASAIPHPYNFAGIVAGIVLVLVGTQIASRKTGKLEAPFALMERVFAWFCGGAAGIILGWIVGFFR